MHLNRHAGLSADRWKLDVSGSWKRYLLHAAVALSRSVLRFGCHREQSSRDLHADSYPRRRFIGAGSIGKSPHFQLTLFESKSQMRDRPLCSRLKSSRRARGASAFTYLPGIGRLFVYGGRRVDRAGALAWFVAVVRGYSKKPRAARTRRTRERREK